jgi:magnesium and cobalt exporter, CNNM family
VLFALWITLPILLIASAIASGSETALFSLTGQDRAAMAGGPRGRAALRLLARPRLLLVQVLVLNMTVNVLYFVVSTLLVYRAETAAAAAAISIGSVLGIVLFGEVIAKVIAGARCATIARVIAGPMLVIQRVLWPLLSPLDRLVIAPLSRVIHPGSSEMAVETRDLTSLLAQAGSALSEAERSLLEEVVELRSRRVGEVMTPRVDLVTVREDWTADDIRAVARAFVPVTKGGLDAGVLGTVDARKALLGVDQDQAVIKPVFVPETATLDGVLGELGRTGVELAYCVDERGAIVGMVTLDDIVDELSTGAAVGADEQASEIEPGRWRVSGRMGVRDFAEQFSVHDIEAWAGGTRVSTVSGLVAAALGRIAAPGDELTLGRFHFRVAEVSGRAIETLEVTPAKAVTDD